MFGTSTSLKIRSSLYSCYYEFQANYFGLVMTRLRVYPKEGVGAQALVAYSKGGGFFVCYKCLWVGAYRTPLGQMTF